MNQPVLQSQIEAARAYESLFVPALFGQWASVLADSAGIGSGQRVLDVACGTGVVAREARERTGPSGYIVGLDPNPGMLAVAKELAPTVDWREGTAESVPFPDASFDRVVSQFGLMFFVDRQQALREMLRVLAPEGRLVVAVWGSLDQIPAYAAEVALLERLAGKEAADALRAPFILGDRRTLVELFEEAGAASVEVTTHQGTGRFPSLSTMVEADLRGWLPVMGVDLPEDLILQILRKAEPALGPHVTVGEEVTFELQAYFVTATKP